MSLVQSTINVDSGLSWEENLNSSLSIIDGHNHSPGSGVQIGPSGLNINSDLSIQVNSITNVKSIVFTPQSSLTTLSAIYSVGADLYYNDASGNVIQITSGGSVNATSSGISSGTATASFVSSVLVVNSAPNTPANIQGGSILLGNNVAASKYLTLSPPNAMANNYTLTLPSLPVATNFVTLDTSGNFAAVTNIDNITLQNSSNVLSIKNLGVDTAQIADGAVTNVKRAALGEQISSGTGTFSSGSSSYIDVTNLTVTLTTTGRPVFIGIMSDGTVTPADVRVTANGANTDAGIQFVRDASAAVWQQDISCASASGTQKYPASSFWTIDSGASAGSHTYKVQGKIFSAASFGFVNCVMIAYEL